MAGTQGWIEVKLKEFPQNHDYLDAKMPIGVPKGGTKIEWIYISTPRSPFPVPATKSLLLLSSDYFVFFPLSYGKKKDRNSTDYCSSSPLLPLVQGRTLTLLSF